jgi:choline dehydrogenase
MMEGPGGASIADLRMRNGKRQSVFRSYTYPLMDRPNLTVLTEALVTRVTVEAGRATGVEIAYRGETLAVGADCEVVLSMGTMHTPKVLMQSGIGDEEELRGVGIPVRQHLPGVGGNLHDHPGVYCVWEAQTPLPPSKNAAETTVYWSASGAATPDVFICQADVPLGTDETIARYGRPEVGWTMVAGVAHPKSRGRMGLTGPNPNDPIRFDANIFDDPDDFKTAASAVQLCRAIANSPALTPVVGREVMPSDLTDSERDEFIRDAVYTYWHPCGTAKMGRDRDAVVDGSLKVYGVENLRVADASIMPRITTGNTMAPCVIIGERAAAALIADHSG